MQCGVCGNDRNNREYEAREMMLGLGDTFGYFQCSQCLCLQIKNVPADLSPYYPEGYYSYRSPGRQGWGKRFITRLRDQHAVFGGSILGRFLCRRFPADARLRALRRIPLQQDSRILDVGCGKGDLLRILQGLGFKNLSGADPFNAEEIDYGDGLKICRVGIDKVEGKRDLIMFHHSFEHVPDPEDTLRSAAALLDHGSHCLIRIPIIPSAVWDEFGSDWVQLDAPRHLFIHSVESMQILAAKTGFELVDVVHDSTAFQFWASEQYARGISLADPRSHGKNPTGSAFTPEQIREFEQRTEELNAAGRGDQAAFLLRRTDSE
jgi:SAM-dependent methyltransferase